MDYAGEFDRACIRRAREMAALVTTDDVLAYYAAKYPEGHPSHDLLQAAPLAGFMGGATGVLHDLLAIIDRQAAVIAHLTGQPEDEDPRLTGVPMVCTACRRLVEDACGSGGARGWQHVNPGHSIECPNSGSPVKAMVAAGNERIPLDLAKPAMSVRLDG